jgi:hypothetical protein
MKSERLREVLTRASRRRVTVRVRVGGGQDVIGSVAYLGIDVVLVVPRGAVRPMQILLRAVEDVELVTR